MADLYFTEPICPKCQKDTMKEWVHEYKCRGLNCRLKLKKVFPPDPGAKKNYDRIQKLQQKIEWLERDVDDWKRRYNCSKESEQYTQNELSEYKN